MRGVRVRVVISMAVVAAAFVIPTVARSSSAGSQAGCQPTTLESLFPSSKPDAPSVSTEGASFKDHSSPQPRASRCSYVYAMTYPIAVESPLISAFGTDRDGGARKHKGSDIAAPKLTPVVAVADGEVSWIRNELGGDCCAIAIRHDDGWRSYYIHLNNDTYGTDDGLGYGIAPGLDLGSRVEAGQVLGWVGDSGNAETTISHLHFELRTPANIAIDAAASLRNAARNLSVSADDELASSLLGGSVLPLFSGAFLDDDVSTHAPAIDLLASIGILSGCDAAVSFCPSDPATGSTVTTWLQRSLDITVHPEEHLTYDGADVERALLDQLSAAMSTEEIRGCGDRRFCDDEPLTRGEFAALVAGVLDLGGSAADTYEDDQGHRFEADIDLLAQEGVFDTCARPDTPQFEPDRPITRGEVATFIARVTGLAATMECSLVN